MALRKTSTILASAPEALTITSTYDDFKATYPSAPGWINPAGIAFRTNFSPDGDQLDANFGTWEWDFGDEGAVHFRLPEAWEWGRDANTARSPFPVHTYKDPGTYTVSCTYTAPNGTQYFGTNEVVVSDRSSFFESSEIYCVSPSSDFTDAPAGAVQVTNLAGAFASLTGGKDRFILLHLGETHTVDDIYAMSPSPVTGGGHIQMISTYGSGSEPAVLYYPNGTDYIWFKGLGQKAIFGNIKFQGVFDSTDETGWQNTTAAIRYEEGACNLTVDGIHATKVANGTQQLGLTAESRGIVVTDSLFEEWVAVCHFHGWVRNCGHAGVVTPANPDGLGGGSGRSESIYGTSRHGPYRYLRQHQCSIEKCSTFTNAGWGTLPGAGGYHRPVHQPHVRPNTNGHPGCSLYVGSNLAEGGYTYAWAFSSGGANAVGGDVPGDYIFEGFHFIASANTTRLLEIGFPGTLVRNFTVTIPNVPPEIASGPQYLADPGDGPGLDDPADGDIPIRFQNGTIIDLRDATNGPDQRITYTDPNLDPLARSYIAAGYNNVTFTGMAWYLPNITTPDTADGPIDTTETSAPLYKGLQHLVIYEGDDVTVKTPAQALDTDYATPAGSIFTGRPVAGAGMLADQTTDIPLRDLLGNERGNPTARGAYDDVAV